MFGLAFIFTEVIALSLIGGAVPPMMRAYSKAFEPQREMLMLIFDAVNNMVFYGIFAFATTFPGIWWLGIGSFLRSARRWLGIAMMILGANAFLWGTVQILGVEGYAILELLELPYLLLWPFWILWLGIDILRSSGSSELL